MEYYTAGEQTTTIYNTDKYHIVFSKIISMNEILNVDNIKK